MKNRVRMMAIVFVGLFGCDDGGEEPSTNGLSADVGSSDEVIDMRRGEPDRGDDIGDAQRDLDAATNNDSVDSTGNQDGAMDSVDDAELNEATDANSETTADDADLQPGDGHVEEMGTEGELPNVLGETCAEAFELRGQSILDETTLRFNLMGSYAGEDNYNPYAGNVAGLPPSCSLVYDAIGRDVVYSVSMRPGETFRAWVQPPVGTRSTIALYFIDDCAAGTILDTDDSGACGNNEYGTPGNCQVFGACNEVYEWNYTYPMTIAGVPTVTQTMFLVVDEVAVDLAAEFVFDWSIEDSMGNPRTAD
jgi:hypothetical protein